jgi:hypothetical protein
MILFAKITLSATILFLLLVIAVQRKVIRRLKRDNTFLRQEMSNHYRHDS